MIITLRISNSGFCFFEKESNEKKYLNILIDQNLSELSY